MEENLKYILATVNDWLKFGEAKNAAVIAFNGAAILALIGSVKDIGNPAIAYFIVHITIPGLLLGLLLSLSGMLSIRSTLFRLKSKKIEPNDHILFYGHIAKYSDGEFLNALYDHYQQSRPDQYKIIEHDLSCQIVLNARIAQRKFSFSLWAIRITFIALALSFLMAIMPYYFSSVLTFYQNILHFDIQEYPKP